MSDKLYAVYVSGPDDLFAAPSKEAAETRVKELNDSVPPETAIEARVIEWPFDEMSYARDIKKWDEMYS